MYPEIQVLQDIAYKSFTAHVSQLDTYPVVATVLYVYNAEH